MRTFVAFVLRTIVLRAVLLRTILAAPAFAAIPLMTFILGRRIRNRRSLFGRRRSSTFRSRGRRHARRVRQWCGRVLARMTARIMTRVPARILARLTAAMARPLSAFGPARPPDFDHLRLCAYRHKLGGHGRFRQFRQFRQFWQFRQFR